ncbi:MAG: hypothetical protein ACR2K3_00010 [Nocardioides sp.]
MSESPSRPAALPPDAVLVHIGPRKTGSTAIQSSFFEVAEQLRSCGVVYPGTNARHHFAVWNLVGWSPKMRNDPPPRAWDDLVREVQAHPDERVVISSEHLSVAGPRAIERLVSDFGAERVHVVLVVRPLDKLLPSQWQERVKSMQTVDYESWLGQVLARKGGPHARQFWRGHGLRRVLNRWAARVPPERIVAVVNRGGDRRFLHSTFEALLDLEPGTLPTVATENSSLPWSATELLRRVNHDHAGSGRTPRAYFRIVRRGPLKEMLRAEPTELDELAPGFPASAIEPLRVLSTDRRDTLYKAGVRIVGDPDDLLAPDNLRAWKSAPAAISLDLATAAVVGSLRVSDRSQERLSRLLRETRQQRRALKRLQAKAPAKVGPAALPTAALVAEVRRRAGRRATRPFRRDRSTP